MNISFPFKVIVSKNSASRLTKFVRHHNLKASLKKILNKKNFLNCIKLTKSYSQIKIMFKNTVNSDASTDIQKLKA